MKTFGRTVLVCSVDFLKLGNSLPRSIEAVLASCGGPTPYNDTLMWLKCLCLFLGLYGNEGLLPARWQLRYSGKTLGEQLLSSPTLLWLGPRLGLDTHTAMELLCLIGAALSLAATLLEAFRDSVVFFCLWALYLSMYQVSLYQLYFCYFLSQYFLPHLNVCVCFRWARFSSTSSGECYGQYDEAVIHRCL